MAELSLATQPARCVLCGGHAHAPLGRNDGLGIVRCRGCGLVYVNPQPTEAALRDYYSAQNLMQQDSWSSYFEHRPEQIRALWRRRFADLQRWRNGAGTRLLDVGCGCGDFLFEAKQAGWQVCGFEFSPAVAEVARERYGMSVAVGEISDVVADGGFDIVTLWHVLEHMREPLRVLECARCLLAPGGLLVIEVPNLNFVARKSYRYPMSATLHLYHFTPATLARLVEKAGFVVRAWRPGHTGYLYRNPVKVLAKKCVYSVAHVAYRLLGINVGDATRVYATRPGRPAQAGE